MTAQAKRPFSENPLSAKLRFKLRTLNNFLFAAFIFTAVALVNVVMFSPHFAMAWLLDAASIAILFYLYRVFWDKRTIWIRCPHCDRRIGTNTPWICGSCKGKNENVDDFPFVHRCESCKAEPKAYQCHHLQDCSKLIFLTADELVRNYAYCINPPPSAVENKQTDLEQQKREREYKLSLSRLDMEVKKAELEVAQTDRKFEEVTRKPKSPEEKIEESWSKRRAHTIAAAEIYRREKKANAEKFKDDREMREAADKALDEWYDGGDWERIL